MSLVNSWLRKYWAEIIVFGFILAIFMIDLNPDFTFMCKAADSMGYIYSAHFLYPSYHTSPPLYLLVSHLFLMLPFGTDAWRMGLVSVVSSMGACVFIYLIIRKMLADAKNAKWYALLGVLIYGTSALVICQTIVVQTYATVCLLASGAFYFAIRKQWKLVGLMVGIGLAVHLLMGFVWLIMMGYKEYRKNWKALLITFSFAIFYIYIPLTNRPPYMWFPAPEQVNSVWAFITDTISTIDFVVGSLAIWDFPKRILDTIGIMGVSIGVITIVPIIYYFRHNKVLKNPLFWLMIFPIILFATELDMNTYDYMMVSIPFLSIIACVGLHDLIKRYDVTTEYKDSFGNVYMTKIQAGGRLLAGITALVIVGFGIFNCLYFDIGRTLDSNMSTARLYYQEFEKIPDGAIFMPNYAMEWEAIYLYNAETGKHIYPICMDILPSENYREQLKKDGIKFIDSTNPNYSIMGRETAQSIVAMNENVWVTVSTIPETLQTDVVPANHDISLVEILTEEKLHEIADKPKILWKPWSPYSILTNSCSVKEWRNQLLSTWNVRLFACLGIGSWFVMWMIEKLQKRRKLREEVEDNIIDR